MNKKNRRRGESGLSNLSWGFKAALTKKPRIRHRSRLGKDLARGLRSRQSGISAAYLFLFCFVVALVTGAFVVHLHVRFEGIALGYKTSRARAERANLVAEQRELRVELASLKTPQRVEAEAREKLGMEMPDHDRITLIGVKRKTVLASGGAR